MMNGRAIAHSLTGLGILVLLAAIGFIAAILLEGCTHAEMIDALKYVSAVNDCKVLNRDPVARNACLAGVAIDMTEEALRRHIDAAVQEAAKDSGDEQ